MTWKNPKEIEPEDDQNYLVCYKLGDGSFSMPHRAYYVKEDGGFISLENFNSNPIVVDLYIEMPETPERLMPK